MTAEEVYSLAVYVATEMGVDICRTPNEEEMKLIVLNDGDLDAYAAPIGKSYENRILRIEAYVPYDGEGIARVYCRQQECLPDRWKNPLGKDTVFYGRGTAYTKGFFATGPWEDELRRLADAAPGEKARQKAIEDQKRAEAERIMAERKRIKALAQRLADELRPLGEWHCDRDVLINWTGINSVCVYARYRDPDFMNAWSMEKVLDTSSIPPVLVKGEWLKHVDYLLERRRQGLPYERFEKRSLGYLRFWERFSDG